MATSRSRVGYQALENMHETPMTSVSEGMRATISSNGSPVSTERGMAGYNPCRSSTRPTLSITHSGYTASRSAEASYASPSVGTASWANVETAAMVGG